MSVCGYRPEVIGLDNLNGIGNCLIVPNHTSFLDILTLTGFLPQPMKYVSKAEILRIPFIGWPMSLAGHIALKTDSRRSQVLGRGLVGCGLRARVGCVGVRMHASAYARISVCTHQRMHACACACRVHGCVQRLRAVTARSCCAQLETFKETVASLEDGNSVFAHAHAQCACPALCVRLRTPIHMPACAYACTCTQNVRARHDVGMHAVLADACAFAQR